MPWCPNCETEYQEGIEVCSDCGAALVDELPEEEDKAVIAYISEEELAQKLVDYLEYSNIEAESVFDESEQAYAVSVDEKQKKEARKAFGAFYNVEYANMAKEQREKLEKAVEKMEKWKEENDLDMSEELLEQIPESEMSPEERETIAKAIMAEKVYKPTEVYVKKADESKEMFSTAITFLGFAVLLLVFLVLNAMNIITMFNNAPSLILIGAMSAGCCLVGINAIKRSRRAEIASVEEERLTASLDDWLEANITDEVFADIEKEELSDELLYLRRTEIIRDKLFEAYPDLDESFADDLIEDFYNSHFDDQPGSEEAEGTDEAGASEDGNEPEDEENI